MRKQDFDAKETAIIVIDPWSDAPFPELNERTEKHAKRFILPVVKLAVKSGIPVYIFTNNPEIVDYSTEICAFLNDLVDNENIFLLYYDSFQDTDDFVHFLAENGIKSLFYTGYATQLCVLYRNVGIIPMFYHSDIALFTIPEATAAVVDDDNDALNIQMRNDICTMLSQQGIADIIPIEDYLNYWKK